VHLIGHFFGALFMVGSNLLKGSLVSADVLLDKVLDCEDCHVTCLSNLLVLLSTVSLDGV